MAAPGNSAFVSVPTVSFLSVSRHWKESSMRSSRGWHGVLFTITAPLV